MKHVKSLAISLCVVAGIVMLAGTPAAFAAGPYMQIGTIAVPGGLSQFDIMWVDTSTDLMYFADDGAAKGAGAVDVFDVHGDKFLYKIGLGSFQGLFDATHCCNGPTGVFPIPEQRVIWAGDGNSTIKVISMDRNEITTTINTGGVDRADEMAWDSKDHLMIIGNSSEPTIVFLTVLNTDTNTIQGKIFYPNANGLEQPVWDPTAERFYVPIDGTSTITGEVDAIDPTKVVGSCSISTGTNCGVTGQMFIPGCSSISGMALLPYERLMLSCGQIIGVPSGQIMGPAFLSNGSPISGDEIYFNAGDNQVYWGAATPYVVDVNANQTAATLVPAKAGSHIIAANSNNNHIYLPSSVCGCIEVFAPVADESAGYVPFSH